MKHYRILIACIVVLQFMCIHEVLHSSVLEDTSKQSNLVGAYYLGNYKNLFTEINQEYPRA